MSFPADSFASRVLGLRTALAIAGCLATQGCERATPTATDPDLADGSRAGAASLQPSWLGEADVRRFFVIGNSLSAGTMDGAQFTEGSRCSPPALFARQANVPDFQYPKISEPGLAFDITGFSGGKLELISLDPLIIERNPDAGKLLNGSLSRPYNNAAVPGAMAFEALDVDRTATSFFGNPGYDLLFRGYGTFLEQATKLDATFITVELGTNDALIWTGFGADETAFPPIPAPVFEARYTALIEGALDITGQVVLFTPVSGLDMPLWRTVPPLLVDPSTGTPILVSGARPCRLSDPTVRSIQAIS